MAFESLISIRCAKILFHIHEKRQWTDKFRAIRDCITGPWITNHPLYLEVNIQGTEKEDKANLRIINQKGKKIEKQN